MAIVHASKQPAIGVGKGGRIRVFADRPSNLSRAARIKRGFAVTGAVLLLALAIFLLFAVCMVRSIAQHLPSVATLADTREHPLTTIVSSDGVLLAAFETQHRRPVALEKMSNYLIDATLATEDERFYQHNGV